MKKKLLLLFAGFVTVYYLIHLANDLPNLLHGKSIFTYLPFDIRSWGYRIVDMLAAFMFVLLPYTILLYGYEKRKLVSIFLMIPLSILAVFLLNYKIADILYREPFRLRTFFLQNFFFYIVFVLYGLIFFLTRYAYFRETQQRELALQNRQAELQFLRSQVNPHFLFNSLNNIYALVYSKSDRSLEAIAGLSELLRYLLYQADDQVCLEEELKYIRKFIELQKLRYDYPISANLYVTGHAELVRIPPLLLIPFVENAFKHGDFTGAGQGLLINVHVHQKETLVYCLNKKGKQQKDIVGGIGLDNVRRRLELLYPGKHVLHIDDNDQLFSINLTLQHE